MTYSDLVIKHLSGINEKKIPKRTRVWADLLSWAITNLREGNVLDPEAAYNTVSNTEWYKFWEFALSTAWDQMSDDEIYVIKQLFVQPAVSYASPEEKEALMERFASRVRDRPDAITLATEFSSRKERKMVYKKDGTRMYHPTTTTVVNLALDIGGLGTAVMTKRGINYTPYPKPATTKKQKIERPVNKGILPMEADVEPKTTTTTSSTLFTEAQIVELLKEETKQRNGPNCQAMLGWAPAGDDTTNELLMWVQKVVLKKAGFTADQETVQAYTAHCKELAQTKPDVVKDIGATFLEV
eukprot:TRINITY_DN94163_c0_g1_i1.p1 TRINITY_DN94163_c0_g1~~TRINITY_DN94163_c0_g1_i1.p1  ORF type:complete len:298 (-),score=43.30 TRINITY_DN94163_c0_g1_i1:182-1075(-)